MQLSLASVLSNAYLLYGKALLWPFLRKLPDDGISSDPECRWSVVSGGTSVFYLLAAPLYYLSADDQATVWAMACVAFGVAVYVFAGLSLRLAVQVRTRTTSEVRESTTREVEAKLAGDPKFQDAARWVAQQASFEKSLFQRNRNDTFNLKAFDWRGVSFFEDGSYQFASRVNVLLGKNGYGKTLLFRSLVAMLQRDRERSVLLLPKTALPATPKPGETKPAPLRVEVTRNGLSQDILRNASIFLDGDSAVGKIPILAIPDSRFLNRTSRSISATASDRESLDSSGAENYLTQEPFEGVVEDLLTRLAVDHQERRKSGQPSGFERPLFGLLEGIVKELTEDDEFQFSEIYRTNPTTFEIKVKTSGTTGEAIPIQYASQGTLSVLAIFGVIYTFLQALRPELSEDKVVEGAGIVLIDEVDAHLHPSWQQKIMGALTRTFPNVQFIVSAHSPAIVAGCDAGEVSVLRKRPDTRRFYVDTLQQDFLGAKVEDLYKRVFEIEDVDRLYLEFSTKGLSGNSQDLEEQITRLASKDPNKQTAEDQVELSRLWRERRLTGRAMEVREQRIAETTDKEARDALEDQLERMRYVLGERNEELERLKAGIAEQAKEVGDARSVS